MMKQTMFAIATASVFIAACGNPVAVSSKTQTAAVEKKESVAVVGDSSFMLDFPADILKMHDLIKVKLVGAGGLMFERNFNAAREKIQIEKLPAGEYVITVDLYLKGEIKEHGTGKVSVESGKVSLAEVTLDPVEKEKKGGLVVKIIRPGEVVVPLPKPPVKPPEMLPVLSEKVASIVLSESRAIPGCNGFRFEYAREQGEIKFQGCNPLNREPINVGMKLSEEKRGFVEKSLLGLRFLPNDPARKCVAEMIAPGENVRTLSIKEKEGKEFEFAFSAGACGEGKIGSIDPALFDFVAQNLMVVVVGLR